MPKAKPVSLHPLNFDEAIKALMGINPNRSKLSTKSDPKKQQKKGQWQRRSARSKKSNNLAK